MRCSSSLLLSAAHHLRDDVRLQAAAVDQMFGAVIAAGGLQDDFLGTIEDAHDPLGQTNVAAGVANFLGVSRGDFFVIDDAGFGNVETFDAGGVGFDFFQPFRPDNFQIFEAIGYRRADAVPLGAAALLDWWRRRPCRRFRTARHCSSQNAISSLRPATQERAFRDPGR